MTKIQKGSPVKITYQCLSPHLWHHTGRYIKKVGKLHRIIMDGDMATTIHPSNVYDLAEYEFELIPVLSKRIVILDQIESTIGVDMNVLNYNIKDVRNQHHYARFKIQPVVFIMANNLNYEQGAIIKYIMRYDEKNGLEDLEKAKHYLDMMIQKVKGEDIKP